jgi:hypothetical protein
LALLVLVASTWLFGGARTAAQEAPPKSEPPEKPEPSPPPETPQVPSDFRGQTVLNPTGPCVNPPPSVQIQDYYGPLHQFIGTFTKKLDRLSVRDPHYKPGAVLCSLEIRDKFFLFLRDAGDPETFLAAGFDAGLSQAKNNDPQFGQGSLGYARRYGVTYLDEVQFRFFKEFAYPTILSEDPRYYRIGHGASNARRFLRPFRHAIIAYNDKGERMFNFSEWLGEISGNSLSNLYHPGNRRGVAPTAENVALDIGLDIGYDELREFWPEIAHQLRLPFRGQAEELQLNLPPTGKE